MPTLPEESIRILSVTAVFVVTLLVPNVIAPNVPPESEVVTNAISLGGSVYVASVNPRPIE